MASTLSHTRTTFRYRSNNRTDLPCAVGVPYYVPLPTRILPIKQEEHAIKQQQGFISAVQSHPTDVYSESDNVLSCVSRALSQDAFLQLIPSNISSLHSKVRRATQSADHSLNCGV